MPGQVVVFLELVHPDLSHTDGVPAMAVIRDDIWMGGPEDMTDMRTRHGFHAASAHPHPERQLQVLTAPTYHTRVIASNLPKVASIDRKQASGHGWSRSRITGLCPSLTFILFPGEVTRPREASDAGIDSSRIAQEGDGVVIDAIDGGNDKSLRFILDTLGQWFQPSWIIF